MKAPLLLVSLFTATDALPGKVGLITEWTQQQKGTSSDGSTTAETYAYSYDKAGRLTGSLRYAGTLLSGVNTLTERNITYDRSGNLLTLDRYGDSSGTTPTESLLYTYTGPKRNTWTYDAHGNVTSDPQSGLGIAWNAIGLPRTITTSTGTSTASTQRSYLADGSLVQVSDGTTTRLYLGDMVFDKAADGTVTLESAGWEGGRLLPGTGADKILYVVKDHLGSVRVVKDGTGTIRQRFDYYPYGTVSRTWTSSATTDNSEKRYRFSGKEVAGSALTDLTGTGTAPGAPYLDFGARVYSVRTAMWLSLDPLMEEYYGVSPYVYCAENPVNNVDPDGRFAFVPILVKAALGAVVDLGAQMAFQMIAGASFEDAFSQVDWTSVGASALMGPLSALNKGKRFASVAINMLDVGIDYSFSAGFDVAGVDKEGYKIAIDAISSLLTSASSDEIVNLFKEEYNSLVSNASYMAPLTNAERQAVRRKAEFVNGDFFKGFINSLSDFLGVTTGNTSKLLYKDWVEQPTEQKPLVLYYEQWVQSQGPVFQQGF